MDIRKLCWFLTIVFFINSVDSMSRQQLKNTGKALRKSCLAKTQVAEDKISKIEQGKFIEETEVMCYIACVLQMTNIVKNNKLSYEASLKQIDIMWPNDIKEAAKKSAEICKSVASKYKDLCESAYWTTKCMYESGPEAFIFA